MPLMHFAVRMLSVTTILLGADVVSAQNYPTKSVRLITSLPGGTNDLVARIIALRLPDTLGQPVIVDNRGGAVVSGEIVAKAAPDGYTLIVTGSDFWVGPLLRKTPYEVARDFSPVTLAIRQPTIVVVHPSLPVKSIKELIAFAKSKPGGLNYASSTIGSASHTGPELFKVMAGVNIARVPYKSAGAAATALVGGEVQLLFATPNAAISFVKSGKMRALAVTSAEPSALLPDLPTVAATVPGYESVTVSGVFAPAKTPAPIINRLNQEMVRVLNRPEVKEQLFNSGVEPVGSSPSQFAAAVKSETVRLAKLIKDAGIRDE